MLAPIMAPSFAAPLVYGADPFRTDGDVLALAFAPDGTLWSLEDPGVLRQWDLSARRPLAWHEIDEPATVWAFGREARLLAAGGDEVAVWDVARGEREAVTSVPSWVSALAFHPAGRLLATGHDDGTIRLWDLPVLRQVGEWQGHEESVSSLCFSGDGTRLASADEARLILLWDVSIGRAIGRLEGHTDRIPALAWHPDGKRLYSAGWDTTARVWDTTTCQPVILLNSHAHQVYTLALSPAGDRLACADSGHAVHIWDTALHKTLAVLPDQIGEVRGLCFSADGKRLAAGGAERVIRIWDAEAPTVGPASPDPNQSRTAVAVSPDGHRLMSVGPGTPLRVWETATGQSAVELRDAGVLRTFAAGPDGRWIAASCASPPDGLPPLALWDVQIGRRAAPLDGPDDPTTALAFRPDGKLLGSGSYQSSDVWLWDVPSGEPHLLLNDAVAGCSVEALAFHPEGRLLAVAGIDWLATGGSDGRVVLWDLVERKPRWTFPGGARAVAFRPDGNQVAVALLTSVVRVFHLAPGRPVLDLIGHSDAVTSLAYSLDGARLATGGDDRTVHIWDTATGEVLVTHEVDTQVKALCYGSDGRLYTGNGNGSCYAL